MPAGSIKNQQDMDIRPDLARKVLQVSVECLGVGRRHDPTVGGTGLWACCSEEVEPLKIPLQRTARARSRLGPYAVICHDQAKSRLILDPDFDALLGVRGLRRLEQGWEIFLKASPSSLFFLGLEGRGTRFDKPTRCSVS